MVCLAVNEKKRQRKVRVTFIYIVPASYQGHNWTRIEFSMTGKLLYRSINKNLKAEFQAQIRKLYNQVPKIVKLESTFMKY